MEYLTIIAMFMVLKLQEQQLWLLFIMALHAMIFMLAIKWTNMHSHAVFVNLRQQLLEPHELYLEQQPNSLAV